MTGSWLGEHVCPADTLIMYSMSPLNRSVTVLCHTTCLTLVGVCASASAYKTTANVKFCIEKESKWLIIKFSTFCHWDENCPFKLNVLSQCVGLYWVFIEMLSAHKYPYCSQRLWLSPESALLTALQLYWCITQYLFTRIWISISQREVFNHGIHVSDMSDRSVLKNCWWHFFF